MSEKKWITFWNIFLFHQYTMQLLSLKYLDIKKHESQVLYRKKGMFSICFISNVF